MPHDIATLFSEAARDNLNEGFHKIEHCLAQLTDEQLWWRPRPDMNSIANLMLHLSGNLRQWIISGIGGAPDVRNRPKEFADRSSRPKSEILKTLQSTVAEADAILARLDAARLIADKRIQGYDTNITEAAFSTISHFRGHVQEIIHMTREIVEEKYQFDFVPKGKEQESAGNG